MTRFIRTVSGLALAAATGGCWGGVYESPAAQYLHRTDTITLSAGNAKEINAAIHTIDPWPRRVADRRIPANGDRMSNAIQHYRAGPPAPAQPQAGPQVIGIPVGAATPTAVSTTSPAPPTQ